ncbi:MAG: tryptophan synthase beta chain [Arenicella sp.]|jgi:tryptophan synthase beta chain
METLTESSLREYILNSEGYFGEFGGCFVPEVIRPNMEEVAQAFKECKTDEAFLAELHQAYSELCGRPTPLTFLKNLTEKMGGAQIYLKNEGLNHTGAHKINHCIGQVLLAKKLGKKRIIAETGAGQHGYATAAVCARYQIECVIYMGKKDYERQRPNVYWMELQGATVIPVFDGEQTLNDAVIAAFKDLIANPEDSYYLLGSAVGPHPYPVMNTYFQKVVGEEIKKQSIAQIGKLPDICTACVGGGSNAMGAFFDFLDDEEVRLVGVEAGGRGQNPGEHAAKVTNGEKGIFEGYYSYFLQDNDGNISSTHSISAGLDYCGVSPVLAHLHNQKRVEFTSADDVETLEAIKLLAQNEGIILALESAHSLAYALKEAEKMTKDQSIVINGSGRGEKDLFITMKNIQPESFTKFMASQLEEMKGM